MFFERRCVICEAPDGPVCGPCHGRLRRVPGQDQAAARGEPRAVFEYDEQLRRIVVALKYRRERRLARWSAACMAELVPDLGDAITWVPATPERARWRGFDQAQEIAGHLARLTRIPLAHSLRRGSGDARQTDRDRRERDRGPQLRALRSVGGLVILVDDVTTTGATLRVATDELRRAGAAQVIPVVLGSTPL